MTLDPSRIGGSTITRDEVCPNSVGFLRGRCQHGAERWIPLSCKKRTCPICGRLRKRKIAWRIDYGLQVLGNAAWFVGTWDYDVTKPDACQTQRKFIQWLRRDQGLRVEYAAVWETTKAGRLHLNLILAPWIYLDQKLLSRKWTDYGGGPVVWIEKVQPGITVELVKARHKLANYMAKFEQMVLQGRGINYSRGWPKPPPNGYFHRRGDIHWIWLQSDYDEAEQFEADQQAGIWREIIPGEYSLMGEPEDCDCFDWLRSDTDPPLHHSRASPALISA